MRVRERCHRITEQMHQHTYHAQTLRLVDFLLIFTYYIASRWWHFSFRVRSLTVYTLDDINPLLPYGMHRIIVCRCHTFIHCFWLFGIVGFHFVFNWKRLCWLLICVINVWQFWTKTTFYTILTWMYIALYLLYNGALCMQHTNTNIKCNIFHPYQQDIVNEKNDNWLRTVFVSCIQ